MSPLEADVLAGADQGSRTARGPMSHAPLLSTQELGQRHRHDPLIHAPYGQAQLQMDRKSLEAGI